MERTILTNMCMIYDRERDSVVIQHRTGSWPGCAFPGGHIEPGEAFVPSVIREVWEETGLRIEQPKLCGIKHWYRDDGTRYLVFLYAADCFSGTLVEQTEEGRVEWVKLDQLSSLQLSNTFLPMAEIMAEQLGIDFPNTHPGCQEYYFEPSRQGGYVERFY